MKWACRTSGIACLVVAIAGPQWGRREEERLALGRDIIAVLDLSRSMRADDTLGQLGADRLGSAKDALVDLSNAMVRLGGHRLGLVVFASRARLVCPLTHDYAFFRDAVAGLDAEDASLETGPGPGLTSGTRIGAGILKAVQAQDPDFAGYQNIVLLSDGDDPARRGVASRRCRGQRGWHPGRHGGHWRSRESELDSHRPG